MSTVTTTKTTIGTAAGVSASTIDGAANSAARGRALPQLDIFLVALCLVGVALLAVLAWPMLAWWYWEYTKPESYYGHAFFVPILIAVMLWHRRDALRAALAVRDGRRSRVALLLLIPSLALLIFALKQEMQALQSQAFLLTLVGGVWLVAGGAFVRAAAVPLGFLWLMAPLPGPVLNDATLGIQSASTAAASKLLGLLGMANVRQGNVIILENYTMTVATACSGFNLLLRLLTFSAAFAYLTDTAIGRRLLLFVISLPLAVVINAIRIALIGVVGECLGASAAAAFHDWSGLISLVLCMTVLFAIARVLGCRTFAGQPIF
jgi:exosortase